MFDKLIRRIFESSARARVGFLSEPTAIVAGDHRERKVRVVSLEDWYAIDKDNGDDAASATLQRGHGGHYAIVVSSATSAVTVVELGKNEARAQFLDHFLAEGRAVRNIVGGKGELVSARYNPPPPPPPPTDEFFWGYVTRLDAVLRIARVPIVDPNFREAIIDPNFRDAIVDPKFRGGGPG